jgi:hypothetical protein
MGAGAIDINVNAHRKIGIRRERTVAEEWSSLRVSKRVFGYSLVMWVVVGLKVFSQTLFEGWLVPVSIKCLCIKLFSLTSIYLSSPLCDTNYHYSPAKELKLSCLYLGFLSHDKQQEVSCPCSFFSPSRKHQTTSRPAKEKISGHNKSKLSTVGEFRKNLSPSKCRVWRNSRNEFSGWLTLWRSEILNLQSPEVANQSRSRILNLQSPEVRNLWRSGILNLRSPEVVNLWRFGIRNSRSLEVANLWGYGAMNLRNSEIGTMKFGNLLKIKFGGYGARRFLWIKTHESVRSCHTRFPKQTKWYLYVCQDLVPYI